MSNAHHTDFVDRRWEGYTGAWRYLVREIDAGSLAPKTTLEVEFRRRADAAFFYSQLGLRGAQRALDLLGSTGARIGKDFRAKEPR